MLCAIKNVYVFRSTSDKGSRKELSGSRTERYRRWQWTCSLGDPMEDCQVWWGLKGTVCDVQFMSSAVLCYSVTFCITSKPLLSMHRHGQNEKYRVVW